MVGVRPGPNRETLRHVGFLHPGEMGAGVARQVLSNGVEVHYASEGRSQASRARAREVGLVEHVSVKDLVNTCGMIVSLCPPAAASATAELVMRHGFDGIFVDANAISPDQVRRIAALVEAHGARFIDGAIIGQPPSPAVTSWLHLSGDPAADVSDIFATPALRVVVHPSGVGAASALKMCYAAWGKGAKGLLIAVRALARAHGVDDALLEQWDEGSDALLPSARQVSAESEIAAGQISKKGWRWVGEMEEIASTFEEVTLPGGFHAAVASMSRRLADRRDEVLPLAEVIEQLLGAPPIDQPSEPGRSPDV